MANSKRKGMIPDEAKIGAAFLLAIIIFVLGLFYLKEIRVTGGTYLIRAEFDNISGTKRSDPILLGGVQIGKVEAIGLDNQTPYVVLRIEDAYQIPDDSSVEAISRSVMGDMALSVKKGDSTTMVPPNGVLKGQTAAGLGAILSSADSLSGAIQTLMANANRYFDPDSDISIKHNLDGIQELTGAISTTLRRESQQIHRVMADLDSLLNDVRDISSGERDKLSATLSNMQQASAQLTALTAQLQQTTRSLDTILQRMERGEGTLGRLLKDDKLYVDMDRLMVNLDGLVVDLKNNPKRYFSVSIF